MKPKLAEYYFSIYNIELNRYSIKCSKDEIFEHLKLKTGVRGSLLSLINKYLELYQGSIITVYLNDSEYPVIKVVPEKENSKKFIIKILEGFNKLPRFCNEQNKKLFRR